MSGKRSLLFSTLVLLIMSSCEAQSTRQKLKCPRRCHCFPASQQNGWDVNCGHKKLTDLPNIPKNTITLVMQDNQLLQVLPKSFIRNKKLQNLYLYNNDIRRVHWDAFQGLGNLQILSLYGNKLTEINNGTFKDLKSLKKLYLYLNRIKTFNKNSFVGLSSLELLSLRDNALTTIQPGTFSPLGQLDSLFLFRNNLTKLTNGMFEGLRSLRTLIIGMNKISTIENEAFKGLSRLTELYIDNNNIHRINSRMFADLTSLKRLHIYNNAIKAIDPGSFFRLRELTLISAHHNKIHELNEGMFAGLSSLKVLQLQANRILQINSKSFADLKSLRTLYLYQNKIAMILKDSFVGLDNLKQLHLGFNMISEIADDSFVELKQLTTLYLDSNKISRIAKGTLAGLTSLLDLYVYFNQISYVANNAFFDNKVLRYISWNVPRALLTRSKYQNTPGNVLFCDCHAKYLKRWLSRHSALEISCFEPMKLRNTPLKRLTKPDLEKCYEPRVKTEPSITTVKTGGNIKFHCTGAPTVEYMWYKNGSKISSKNDFSVSSFGTLSVKNVKKADDGLYVCVAKNKKSFAIAPVSLSVGHKPYFTITPESTEVYIGSKVILGCEVQAKPRSEITWKKYDDDVTLDEKRVFQTRQGTLIILDVRLSDAAVYTCTASNKLGMIATEVTVDVKKGKNPTDQRTTPVSCTNSSIIVGGQDIDVSGSGENYDDDDDGGDDDQ